MAEILDKYCDIILVGDSLGMVLHGMKSTREVTLDMMIMHGKAVKRGINASLLVVDMPIGTYEKNPMIALKNAKKIIKETKKKYLVIFTGGLANIFFSSFPFKDKVIDQQITLKGIAETLKFNLKNV